MTNKTKRLTKIGILTLGITFIVWNCQKDDTTAPVQEIEEAHQDNYSINYVSGEKIPSIISILGSDNSSSSKTGSSKSSSISAPFGIISIENVLEVVDTLGNQNYSFTLIPKTPKPNSIFNLVVSVVDGVNDIAIMEYRMAPSFAQSYRNGTKTLAQFTGSILKFPFNSSSNIFSKSNGNTCVQNIDEIVNCDEITLNNGNSINSGEGAGSTTLGSTNTYTGADGGDVTHNYGDDDSASSSGGSLITVTYSNCTCGVPEIVVVKITPLLHSNKSNITKKSNNCCDGTNTSGSIGVNLLTPVVDYITSCIPDLTQSQIDFLNSSLTSFAIKTYLESNKNPDGSCNQEVNNFVKEAIDILVELPDAKFERIVELNGILKDNPWALIQDCAEQNGLDTSNYLELYNLPFPQECSDRLFNMGVEWHHQPITDGNVPLANIDYYGVEISSKPDFNNDGNPDSEAEMYQAFREKFIDVASGDLQNFQFSCDIPFNSTDTGDIGWEFIPLTTQDGIDFISDNPIASILLIEADAQGILPTIAKDDGAVIVSDFTTNDWTISTIMTANNGTQPFSGNRQWGWLINQNGNFEFFTRAVDVANISKLLNIGANTECQQETYYDIAEATWENMQQEIYDWINSPESNGGQATISTKKAVRCEKGLIEKLLTSNETIDEINCD